MEFFKVPSITQLQEQKATRRIPNFRPPLQHQASNALALHSIGSSPVTRAENPHGTVIWLTDPCTIMDHDLPAIFRGVLDTQLSVEDSKTGQVSTTDMANINQTGAQPIIAPMVIKAVGVDERMLFAISLFFKNRLAERYTFGTPQDADIWLFDVDNIEGRAEWAKHQATRPGIPAILVSIEEKNLDHAENAAFAAKPLSAELLADTLERVTRLPKRETAAELAKTDTRREPKGTRGSIAESSGGPSLPVSDEPDTGPTTFMPDTEWYQDPGATENVPEVTQAPAHKAAAGTKAQHTAPDCSTAAMKLGEQRSRVFIGSTPDIDPDDPRQWEKAQYDPDDFLAGAVSRAAVTAADTQRPVRVSGRGWTIVIRPSPDRAFVDIKKLHLRTLATLRLEEEPTTEPLNQTDIGQNFDGVKWRLPALEWTLTLMAARGRVPIGTDMGAKVKLKHWPNLTRLQNFPHAMRIASLWSRQPISLLETASVLEIPQRYVFTFYSAVHATGLVETVHAEQAEQGRSDSRPAKRRGLFRKILAHLRLG